MMDPDQNNGDKDRISHKTIKPFHPATNRPAVIQTIKKYNIEK